MNRTEERYIALMRRAIEHLETDSTDARCAYQDAHDLFGGRLMRWSKSFAALQQELYKIWCDYTPQPRGQYRTRHVRIGYSSIETRRWIDDPIQPERPSVAQLLARFDAAIEQYKAKGEK